MYWLSRHRMLLLTILVMVGGTVLCAVAAGHYAWRRALGDESSQVQRQLQLYGQGLQQRIDRFGTLPQVMALDPDLLHALRVPPSPGERQRLNLKLQRANEVTRASTLTLVGHDGVAVAASNWDQPTSNVGENYSYRPYYRQALAQGRGRFYGIGMTTGVPGYYLSQAIEADGKRLGVVVIKVELSALEQEWLSSPDVVLASDDHDVVFLSNRDSWRYRLLRPLRAGERREMLDARQYADRALQPLRARTEDVLSDGGRMVRLLDPALPQPMLWQSLALPAEGWNLHLLRRRRRYCSRSRGRPDRRCRVAGLGLPGAVRAATQAPGQASPAQPPRTGNPAQAARTGAAHRTGWPAAGRHRRRQWSQPQPRTPAAGCGGDRPRPAPGRVEFALSGTVPVPGRPGARRPADRGTVPFQCPSWPARSRPGGRGHRAPPEPPAQWSPAHARERKDDGTVLEIRGNPLPDGGFVTSYADITSYKNAARELRSLADALEHRIAERTRDLDEARREAEQANRYKTRFVASAVHDLLQPLNAARMFVSVLRGKLGDPRSSRLPIISMPRWRRRTRSSTACWISRGWNQAACPPAYRRSGWAPAATLAREFGIAAQSRGLVVDWVDSHAVVVSDEALLRRILQNFLSNALRYSERGRVLLGCRRREGLLWIEVHDQGPGIPDALQGEIFEEFRRLHDGQQRGAGLGLAIVDRIGRLLGHPIRLRSQLGRGSVFAVGVPFGEASAIPATAPAPVLAQEPGADNPLRGRRVWVIDDDPHVCGQPCAAGALGLRGGAGRWATGGAAVGQCRDGSGAGAAGCAHGRSPRAGAVRDAGGVVAGTPTGGAGHCRARCGIA